jgi:hypothetical protein
LRRCLSEHRWEAYRAFSRRIVLRIVRWRRSMVDNPGQEHCASAPPRSWTELEVHREPSPERVISTPQKRTPSLRTSESVVEQAQPGFPLRRYFLAGLHSWRTTINSLRIARFVLGRRFISIIRGRGMGIPSGTVGHTRGKTKGSLARKHGQVSHYVGTSWLAHTRGAPQSIA